MSSWKSFITSVPVKSHEARISEKCLHNQLLEILFKSDKSNFLLTNFNFEFLVCYRPLEFMDMVMVTMLTMTMG